MDSTPSSLSPSTDPAFSRFFRTFREMVRALCAARCASQEDVDEAESVVWWDVYANFTRFEVEDPRRLLHQLVTWRVRNLYRSGHRKYEKKVEQERLLSLLESSPQGGRAIEQRVILEQVLTQESPEDQELLVGRYVEEMTCEELAARHGLHRNTVSRRTEASLRRLRSILEHDRSPVPDAEKGNAS